MTRQLIAVLAAALSGQPAGPPSPAPAGAFDAADRETLRRYARDTWRGFEALATPGGLVADGLHHAPGGDWSPSETTSPTDLACYLWAVLAADRLGLTSAAGAADRLDRALAALQKLERSDGFFFNQYHARTGLRLGTPGKKPARPFLSTVDNGWLAAALMMVGNAHPEFKARAEDLLRPMDFGLFYVPYDPADPRARPGQLHGGLFPDGREFTTFYGMVNTEPRIASYIAIARGQVPPEHYYRLYRTLPPGTVRPKVPVGGEMRSYLGVPVFEGHHAFRGFKVVPSWGGSMFEALMVTLLVPEDRWAPSSWGVNHPLYVRAQIKHSLAAGPHSVWGFSPCCNPKGGYSTYGVDALGANPEGYLSNNADPRGAPVADKPPGEGERAVQTAVPDNVVTPHASFLALRFAPGEALANLRALAERYPTLYGEYGFRDSVDVGTGRVADCVLALDQGMTLAALANALADDALQHLFADGPVEAAVRPLIAPEAFTAAGPP